jgi:peptide-methionine (R)-S-oxide reductase
MMRAAILILLLAGCSKPAETPMGGDMKPSTNPAPATTDPQRWTEAEWRAKLTPEEYRVLREQGTEAPYSGKLLHNTAEGRYVCAGCGQVLFVSVTKYDACGWPSFYDAIPGTVTTRPDGGALEAVCSRCGSHLGHIFDDGPAPTGQRY